MIAAVGHPVTGISREKNTPLQVLLVDDDEDDFVFFSEMAADINQHQIQVTWADSYQQALKSADETACDLFFVDYRLGAEDGLTLLQVLRQRGHHQPFILLTGQGAYNVDLEAMEQGASDYVEKDLLSPQLLERVIRYALSRASTLKALQRSEKKLRALSEKLIYAQETERTRLARELHDSTSARLTAIKYALEKKMYEEQYAEGHPHSHYLNYLIELVQETSQDIQRIYSCLRPTELDILGLIPAVRRLCRDFQGLYGSIRVTAHVSVAEEDIPESLKIVIYRLLQESLNNVAKHSQANQVCLELSSDADGLRLLLSDNGRGFDVKKAEEANSDPHSNGFGLISMTERALFSGGNFTVDSLPGQGTTLAVVWPGQGKTAEP